jgi:hypothetical protein
MATKPDPAFLVGVEATLAQLIEGNRELLELGAETERLIAELVELAD